MGSENAAQMTESINHYFVDQRSDTPVARIMSGGSYSFDHPTFTLTSKNMLR